MSKNRFITIEQPTGIMIMINETDDEIYVCTDCLKPSEKRRGHITNKKDCEHGAKERR